MEGNEDLDDNEKRKLLRKQERGLGSDDEIDMTAFGQNQKALLIQNMQEDEVSEEEQ